MSNLSDVRFCQSVGEPASNTGHDEVGRSIAANGGINNQAMHALQSADARLLFEVCAGDAGVFVRRSHLLPKEPVAPFAVSMIFGSVEAFTAWLDDLSLRFDEPLLHRRLRRLGEELFDGKP